MTPASTSLTLVTGFWDPATLGHDAGRRPAPVYLRLFEELHRTVPWPIVVWVDPGWADVGIRRDVPTILDGLAYCRERGLWAIGTDVAKRLIEAMYAQHVLLTPAQAARLLHEAFICAYDEDRPLAERLARILSSLYLYGKDEFRRTLDAWQPLVEQNVRRVGVDLSRPAWTFPQLLAQPDFGCWRVCL